MSTEILEKIECEGGCYYKHPDATIENGAQIGLETKIWEGAHVFSGAKIGEHCILGAGVHIEHDVELGSHGKVQRGVVLYSGLKVRDYVFFGPNATTTNDRNPRAFGPWELTETIVGTGASIGANATLIAGNEVGPLALVAAGAVVTKPVGAAQAVAGNPARFMGWVNPAGRIISRNPETPTELVPVIDNPLLAIERYLIDMEGSSG